MNKKLTILTLAFWCALFFGSSVYADTPITLHSGENRIPITVNVIRPLDITFSSNSSSFGTVSAKDASGNPIDVSIIAINEGSTYTISEDGTTINFSTNESITATPNTPPAGKAINFKGWKIGSSSDPVTSGTGTVDSTTTSFEAVFEEVDAPVPGGGDEGSEGSTSGTGSEDSSVKVPDTGLFTIFSSASDGKSFFIALACIIFIAEVAIVIYELKRYKKEAPKIDFKENVPITELVNNLKRQQENQDKTVKKVLISSTSTAFTAIIIAACTITALIPNYNKVPPAIKPLGATTSEGNGVAITINLNEDAGVSKLVSRQINIPVDAAPYGFILSQYYEDRNTNLIDSANGKFLPLGDLSNYETEDKNDFVMAMPNTYCAGANYWAWADVCTTFNDSEVTLAEYYDEIRSEDYVSDFDLFIRLSDDFPVGEYKGTVILNVDPQPLHMQSVANWGDSLTSGVQVKATDIRDNKEYYVARLADGNVWMTQNLDFDLNSSTTYTPSNTDIPANWTPSTSTYAKGVTAWNHSTTSPESYDPGNLCWNGVLDENGETTLDNGTTACVDGSNMNYSIGNYYNWTAAVAMNDSSSYTTQEDVNQSICPAGWMLPKSGATQTGSGSFQYLVNQLSLTSGTSGNIQNTPVFFTYGGYWGGKSYNVGSVGYYWSSVVGDSDNSYFLLFGVNGTLAPSAAVGRVLGYPVRCVAR